MMMPPAHFSNLVIPEILSGHRYSIEKLGKSSSFKVRMEKEQNLYNKNKENKSVLVKRVIWCRKRTLLNTACVCTFGFGVISAKV